MKMLYVRVCASETTVTLVGHCNPLCLSLSAFLYLYSKCQCINAFSEGVWGLYCHGEEESMGKKGAEENGAETRGCLCALGEPCKQHGGGWGDLQGEIGVY